MEFWLKQICESNSSSRRDQLICILPLSPICLRFMVLSDYSANARAASSSSSSSSSSKAAMNISFQLLLFPLVKQFGPAVIWTWYSSSHHCRIVNSAHDCLHFRPICMWRCCSPAIISRVTATFQSVGQSVRIKTPLYGATWVALGPSSSFELGANCQHDAFELESQATDWFVLIDRY